MRFKVALIASLVCLWAATADASAIVYSNLTNALGNYLGGFKYVEAADDVTLGPGSRTFQSLKVAYAGFNFNGDETLTVSIYKMDGAPTPGSFGFNTPGTVLFTATQSIVATNGAILTFTDNTGILLENTVAVGLKFGGVEFDPTGAGADAGPLLYHPPTVGSSLDDYWLRGFPNPADPWGLYTFGGNPPINFGMEIEAVDVAEVPEPASMGLLATGIAGLILRRVRARRS